MLRHLTIQNYALIRELSIEPASRLNIITGETGAGKSIMLGAIGLMLGKRADTKVLYDGNTKCIIEGEFDISGYKLQLLFEDAELDYENVTTIRREISPAGKSRAFINDTPVTLDVLRNISSRLVDVHSQHETLQLASDVYQLELLDHYAQNSDLLDAYQHFFRQFRKTDSAYRQLLQESQEIKKELDYNQHLLHELDEAGLDELQLTELEEELEILEHAGSIKANLNETLEYLTHAEFSVENGLKSALQSLGDAANLAHHFQSLRDRLNSLQIDLSDILLEIEKEETKILPDEERMQALKEKLDLVYSLQHKHHADNVEVLIEIRNGLQEKVERVLNFDEELANAQKDVEATEKAMKEAANRLSKSRQAALKPMSEEINGLLGALGMPNAVLSIEATQHKPSLSGADEVNFRFSANKGIAPEPLKDVASGGEFSRLMLSVKYVLARKTLLPTIIFDEIDTGISGEIAIKVGKMLKEMATRHQVMAISHLPQIAARGTQHYYVFKDDSSDKSVSRIRLLEKEERINEIAQMIGGANPSPTAFESARELMK